MKSLSIKASGTSINRPKQIELAVPPSKISALSSGEFVGMVADDLDCKIDLKTFHSEILNDHNALKNEQEVYKDIQVICKLDNTMVQRNYLLIKLDIIHSEMVRLLNDPGLSHMLLMKGAINTKIFIYLLCCKAAIVYPSHINGLFRNLNVFNS